MLTGPETEILLPNFLIVGAAKSGTSALYEFLKTHPEVFMPSWKEPTYFAPTAGGSLTHNQYIALFNGAAGFRRIGEASVAYLMDEEAPVRIADTLGNQMKIVILLRNPVDRSYSHWLHHVRDGTEQMTFREAIRDEQRRLNDPAFREGSGTWFLNLTYVERSRYYRQVKRYIDTFSRENVLVFTYEEFFQPGLPRYPELCSFLEIDDIHQPVERVYNKASAARSLWLQNLMRSAANHRQLFKPIPRLIRARIWQRLETANRIDKPLPKITKEESRMVMNATYNDVEELSRLIDYNFIAAWDYDQRNTPTD